MDCRAARLACLVSFRSAVLLVCLQVAYAVMLTSGLLARVAPDRPIGDPYFIRMEGLVLAIMPAMICFAAGVHALTEPQRRVFSLAALVFLAVATAITLSKHGAILFLSRDPAFAGVAHVFAFEWPSAVYLLDVLAWYFFFGLFALSLALSFGRHGPAECRDPGLCGRVHRCGGACCVAHRGPVATIGTLAGIGWIDPQGAGGVRAAR